MYFLIDGLFTMMVVEGNTVTDNEVCVTGKKKILTHVLDFRNR